MPPEVIAAPDEIEYRDARFQFQERGDDGKPVIRGYASTFNDPYEVEWLTETIDPGAFERTLRERPDVFALVGHKPDRVIARTLAGTLNLKTDAKGLLVEIKPIDTQESRDAFCNAATKTIDAFSFGFSTQKEQYTYEKDAVKRRVMDCTLYEISLVAWPANPNARLCSRARQLANECRKVAPLIVTSHRFRLPPAPLASMQGLRT